MKIKAIAAAGAIGLGMGFAGLITAGTASADQCGKQNTGCRPHRHREHHLQHSGER